MLCLTARLSSPRWRSCWGPRLCRGTERCLLECAGEGRSPAGTVFPGEEEEEEKAGWLLISNHGGMIDHDKISQLWRDCVSVRHTRFKATDTLKAVVGFAKSFRALTKLQTAEITQRSTFLGSMLNFFLPIAICLFLWEVLLEHKNKYRDFIYLLKRTPNMNDFHHLAWQ